jgi:hypothetical protein
MIVSMGWDYVSELLLPTGVLFIPQVIYEHGEPWWNDIERGRLLILQPELYGIIAAESCTKKSWGTWRRKLWIWRSEYLCSYFEVILRNILHGASIVTSPPKEGVLHICIAPKSPSPQPGLNPRNLGPVASTLAITAPRRLWVLDRLWGWLLHRTARNHIHWRWDYRCWRFMFCYRRGSCTNYFCLYRCGRLCWHVLYFNNRYFK